jgi:WD40 repeat protein
MKLVRGVSLRHVLDLLARNDPATVGSYSLSALLIVFQKVCDAVAFAHSRGVIHRDLKPENIMLGEYGEVLVMDWGLAKVMADPSSSHGPSPGHSKGVGKEGGAENVAHGMTQNGMVVGTLQYMSPEQASGKIEELDEACDIYALGAILHHVLALRPPIEGTSEQEVLANVCSGRFRPLRGGASGRSAHLPGGAIPTSLRAVAEKAMALEPRARYGAVKSLQADIAAYQSGFVTTAEDATTWKRGRLFIRRHRTACTAAALLLIASAISTAMIALARHRARAAERVTYVADMLEAGRYVTEGRVDGARELLSRHLRETTGRDLRGWEWFHLQSQLNQDRLRTHAHNRGVYALAVTMDGMRLASGGGDGDVAVWQARGLRPEFRLPAHNGAVLCVAWQIGGTFLASGGADGMVRIWDTKTQTLVAKTQVGDGGAVRALAWQPLKDGTGGVAIGGEEQNVRLWFPLVGNPPQPPEILFPTQHGVASLHWSADGARLACGKLDAEKTVEVFDMTSRSMVFSNRPSAGHDVLSTAVSASGNYVAAGSKHFAVAVFDLAKNDLVFEREVHRGSVRALAWSPGDKQLASASQDGTIRIFRRSQPDEPPLVFCGHLGEVVALVWTRISAADDPEGEQTALFSGGADGTLRAWAPNAIEHVGLRTRRVNWIAAARWSPDATRIAMVNFRDQIYMIDRASGSSLPFCSTLDPLFDVAWSPNADRLVVASRQTDRVEVLEATTGRPRGIFTWPAAEQVAWSPSGKYFVAAGAAGTCTWNAQTGEKLATISRPTGSVAWHADDRHMVLGAADGAIELWDGLIGKKKAQWRPPQPVPPGSISLKYDPPCQVLTVKWSPDMRYLAFGTMDKIAGLIRADEGRVVRAFSGHTGGVRGVAWSPNGRRLATCNQDGSLRVFIVDTGNLVARIEHGHGNLEIHTIDWSSDGQQLLTGGYDLTLRVWDASRGYHLEAVEDLRRRFQRQPDDAAACCELAESYANLGWADLARHALESARAFASSGGIALDSATRKVEAILTQALLQPPLQAASAELHLNNSSGISLLNAVYHNLKAKNTAAAVAAFQELIARGESAERIALARSYFSQAKWEMTWFSSRVDPQKDLEAWRAQAKGGEAVTIPMRMLYFPYKEPSPNGALFLPERKERRQLLPPFGMIARALISFGTEKWRFRATGTGDVRVILNGRIVLEDCRDSLFEATAEYESTTTEETEVVVEHSARATVPPFELIIEPVLKSAAAPGSSANQLLRPADVWRDLPQKGP